MKEFFRTSDHHCYFFEAKLLAAFNTFLIWPLPTSPTSSFSILLKTSSQFCLYLESSGLCLHLNITPSWLPSLKLHTDSPAEYRYTVFMTTGNYLPCCICLSKLLKRIFFFFSFLQGIWDLSSLTGNQSHALCSGITESKPLDWQGSPQEGFFF